MKAKLKSLKNHQGFMKYFRNTSWLFGEKILRMVVGLFVGVWVARYLGPEQYGLLSYAQSFVGLFAAFATLGLDGIVVRELVKDESRRDELIGTAFWLKLAGSIVVLSLLAIAVNFTSNDSDTNVIVFIIASATVFQAFNVVDLYFQSRVLSKYVVYANVISLFISSMVKIALILNEAPLIAFVWTALFDSMVLASGYVYFFLKANNKYTNTRITLANLTFKRETAVNLLRDSWPLMFSGFMVSIYAQLDQVMLKNMVNAAEVGQYSAAVRFNSIWSFIPSIVLISISPSIFKAKQVSEKLFLERLQILYDSFVVYGLFIIVIVLILGDFLIDFTFGAAYTDTAMVLNFIVFSNIFSYLGAASSRWFMNRGFEKKILFRNVFGVGFNIAGNIVLIPKYGATGAAISTFVTQFAANFIYDFLDKDTKIVFTQKKDALLFKTAFFRLKGIVYGSKRY